jgi:hypothetical protein
MKRVSGAGEIVVRMPTLAQRIAWLNKMFSSSPVEAESTPAGSNEDSPNGSASDL